MVGKLLNFISNHMPYVKSQCLIMATLLINLQNVVHRCFVAVADIIQ